MGLLLLMLSRIDGFILDVLFFINCGIRWYKVEINLK